MQHSLAEGINTKQSVFENSMSSNKSKGDKEMRQSNHHAVRNGRGRSRKTSYVCYPKTSLISSIKVFKGAKRGRPCLNRKNRTAFNDKKLKNLTSTTITPTQDLYSSLKLRHFYKRKEKEITGTDTKKNSFVEFGSSEIAITKHLLFDVGILNIKNFNADRILNKKFPHIFCKMPRILLEKIDSKLKNKKWITNHLTLNAFTEENSKIEIPRKAYKFDNSDSVITSNESCVFQKHESFDNARINGDRNVLAKLGAERSLSKFASNLDSYHNSTFDADHRMVINRNRHFRPVQVDLTNLKMKLKNIDISKYKTRKSTVDENICPLSQNQVECHDQKSNDRHSGSVDTNIQTTDSKVLNVDIEEDSKECSPDIETSMLTQDLQEEESKVEEESCTLLVPPLLDCEYVKEGLFSDSELITNGADELSKEGCLDTIQTLDENTNSDSNKETPVCDTPIASDRRTSYLKIHISNSVENNKEENWEGVNESKTESIIKTECNDLVRFQDRTNDATQIMNRHHQSSDCYSRKNNISVQVKGRAYYVTVPLDWNRNHDSIDQYETYETESISMSGTEDITVHSTETKTLNDLVMINHDSDESDSRSKDQNSDENTKRKQSNKRSHSCDKGYDSDATVIYDEDLGNNDSLTFEKNHIDGGSVLSMQDFSPEVNEHVLSYKPNISDLTSDYQQKLNKKIMQQCDELRFRKVYRNENLSSEPENVFSVPSTVALVLQDQCPTINLRCVNGHKNSLKTSSSRRHSFVSKKFCSVSNPSKTRVFSSLAVETKQKRRRTLSATSKFLYKHRTSKTKTKLAEKSDCKISSSPINDNNVSDIVNNSFALEDGKHSRKKSSEQYIKKHKHKQRKNLNKQRIGFYAVKRKKKRKITSSKNDVIRRVEEIFPNAKTSSQSDGEDLPTILPPKRRRQNHKSKAMIYKSFEESTDGMERLIQEFPRHNWLENKYSAGEVSSNGFDDNLESKKMNELKNLEIDNERIEKETKDNSDTEDTDMVVSTTTTLSDCNDCYDVGSLPIMVANLENGVNVSNDKVDTQLQMDKNDSLHDTDNMIGDSTSQVTNQKSAGPLSKYSHDEVAQDEPHSTLDVTEPDTAINEDNDYNKSQSEEDFGNSNNSCIIKHDSESHQMDRDEVDDCEKIKEFVFEKDDTQGIRKASQHKLPPVPSLIPVSAHKRKANSSNDNALPNEEIIENKPDRSNSDNLSIDIVISDASEPPNKIPCLSNPVSSADTNRCSFSNQSSLSKQLDNTVATPEFLISKDNSISAESANSLKYEFEKHLKEFKQLELLAERKAKEREMLLDLQRQKAELIQKLGLEGLNLARAKAKAKYAENQASEFQLFDISKESRPNNEPSLKKNSSGENANKEKLENSSPPKAHQSKSKTSLDLITKLDASVYSIPPHIKASCPFIARKTAIEDPPGQKEINNRVSGEIPQAHCQAPFETPGRLIFPLPSFCNGQQKLAPTSHRNSTDINNKEKQQPNVEVSRSASAPIQSAGMECKTVMPFPSQSDDFIAPPKSAPISSSANLCQPTDLTITKDKFLLLSSKTKVVSPSNVSENRQSNFNIQKDHSELHRTSEKTDVIDLCEETGLDKRRTEIEVQKELNAALARRQKQENSSNSHVVAGTTKMRGRQNSRENVNLCNIDKTTQERFNTNNITRDKLNLQKAYIDEVSKNMQGLQHSQIAAIHDPNTLKKYHAQHHVHVPNQSLSALTNAILSPPLHPRSKQLTTLPLRYSVPTSERGINLPVVIPSEHIENIQNPYAYIQKNCQDNQQLPRHQKQILHNHPIQHQQQQQQKQVSPSSLRLHSHDQRQNQLSNASKTSGIVQLQSVPATYVDSGSFQQFNLQQRQQLQQHVSGLIPGQLRPQTVRLLGVRKEVRYNTPVSDLSDPGSNRPILPKSNQGDFSGQQMNSNGQMHLPLSTQQQLLLQQRQQQQQLMKNRDSQKIEGLTNNTSTDSLQRQIAHQAADVSKQLQHYGIHQPLSTNSQRQRAPADITQHIQPQNMIVQDPSGALPRLVQVPSSNQNLHYTSVQQNKPMEQHGMNTKDGNLTPLQRAQSQLHSTHAKHVHGNCILCGKYALYLCSGCKQIWYCSPQCQLNHWQSHASECKSCS